MYLIVATATFLLGYDTDSEKIDVLDSGSRFYGVTWSPRGDRLTLTHAGYDGDIADLSDYAMADVGYLTVGERRTWPCLNSPHQAAWVGDRTIVVANTGRNCIACVDAETLAVVQRRYDDAVWDRYDKTGAPGCHYNSVFFDGTSIYFVAHNFARPAFILRASWPSLDPIERIAIPDVSGVHNMWIDPDGRWITCDSMGSSLMDVRSGERLWSSGGEGYTRGLAATQDLLFVGNSEATARSERDTTASGVWILDRRTVSLLDYVELGNFGAVQEVRVADVPDLCHHGVPLSMDTLKGAGMRRKASRAARLARARRRQADWTSWHGKVGGFTPEDAGFVGQPNQLAIMIRRCTESLASATVSARFRLRGHGAADHAGLVLRYGGPLDTRMYAAILQAHGGLLSASIWVEDGGWRQLRSVDVSHHANAALAEGPGIRVAFSADADHLTLTIGDGVVAVVDDATLAVGGAGIRVHGDSWTVADFAVEAKPA